MCRSSGALKTNANPARIKPFIVKAAAKAANFREMSAFMIRTSSRIIGGCVDFRFSPMRKLGPDTRFDCATKCSPAASADRFAAANVQKYISPA
jgi:hypothetical protein